MAIVQGAMLGGTLLPEKEFKELLFELLKNTDFEKQLVLFINRAIKKAEDGNLTGLYNEIEILETQLFQNPETSLMVITNLKSPIGDYSWSWVHSEKNTLTDKGGNIQLLEALKGEIKKAQITQALSEHLLNMINIVEFEKMTNEDYDNLFNNYSFGSKKTKKDIGKRVADKNIHGKTMAYIFYGNKGVAQRRGQIADAFLNHVGNMHRAILGDFTFNRVPQFQANVKDEEGPNFYQLLIDSANNVGWQTGGDLILLDGNKIVANIQLKTIQNASDNYVGKITFDKILEDLYRFKDFIDKGEIFNKEYFINHCYNFFKTSGIMNEVADKIMEIPIEYAKQNLKNINYKGIKITFSS